MPKTNKIKSRPPRFHVMGSSGGVVLGFRGSRNVEQLSPDECDALALELVRKGDASRALAMLMVATKIKM